MNIRILTNHQVIESSSSNCARPREAMSTAESPAVSHSGAWPSGFGVRVSRPARRGFTLVEMLLVLVILATLAAIVYPKVMGRSEQARETAAKTQIANFKTALDAFEVDTGYYPKGRNGLGDLLIQPRDVTGWHGPYLDSIPKDPWGNEYVYECPGKHNPASYDISSPGAPGSQSPIGNWQAQK